MKSILLILLVAASLRADQITLMNGDRITGDIVSATAANLVLKTAAGTLTIPRGSITDILSEGTLYFVLADGRTVSGTVQTADGQFQITTQNQGVVTTAPADLTTIRNEAEQAQYERLLAPGLTELWTGFLDLGYAAARGNANTQTITVSGSANRTTNTDTMEAHYTSIFSSSKITGVNQTTANSKRGGVSYHYNFNPRLFAFGGIDLEFDQFQNLDLRVVPAAGLGYRVINTDATKFDMQVGASGNRERFSTGLKRNSAEALLGDTYTHNFSPTTSVTQKFNYYANLTRLGQARLNFDTTFATRLNGWVSIQFTISDRYLSNPVPGRKTNDILFSAGVRVSTSSQ